MAAVPSENQRVRVGVFEVDLKSGELRRNGSRIRLQEQPLQILRILLEHPGEVVSREEVRSRLWPADTYVDFDHSMNAAVRRLRDAFGDSAENPRFVETVARRGYRLLAPVNGAATAAPALSTLPTNAAVGRRWYLIAAAVLIIGVAFGWIAARWRTHPLDIRHRRLTANSAENAVTGAALSPDGKYLAFSDSTGLYLRDTNSGETHAVNLPGSFGATPTAWYPDSTHLLASRVEGPKTPPALWQISIVGGAPRRLIDDARLGSVSPVGSQIAFVRGPNAQGGIWVMQSSGEDPRRLVEGKNRTFGMPAWSPDGRRIAFASSAYLPKKWEAVTSISIVDLESGREEMIFAPKDRPNAASDDVAMNVSFGSGLAWTRDNQLVYSLSEPPPNQADLNLWSVPLDSRGHMAGIAQRLTTSPDDVNNISVSADGKKIAYTKRSWNPSIYFAELKGTSIGPLQRLTLDEWRNYPYSWTPDGKSLLFSSDRDGKFQIFRQAIDQTVAELVVGGNQHTMLPRIAPDNSSFLYIVWPDLGQTPASRRVMRALLTGGPPQLVLEHEGIGNLQCASRPSMLCVFDVRGPGQVAFFRFDHLTGKSEELQNAKIETDTPYAYNWTLSADGKMLAAVRGKDMQDTETDATITVVSLESGSRHTISVPAWAGVDSLDFAADGRSLWAPVHTNTGKWALLNINLQGRITTVLEDSQMKIGWAIPSPDGKRLALWKARNLANVWMVERE